MPLSECGEEGMFVVFFCSMLKEHASCQWLVRHTDAGTKNDTDCEFVECPDNDDREAVLGLCL